MILARVLGHRVWLLLLCLLGGGLSASLPAGAAADFPEFEDSEFVDGDEFTDDDEFADDELADEELAGLEEIEIWDPLQPLNRGIFWFNDKAYRYVLKPVARGYRVVPRPVRTSVSNFFSNILTPVRFVNSVLQLKFNKAGSELGRFAINTTVGVGGLFDPADKHFKLKRHREDFGQTLGSYGVGHGLYLVFPLLGPSSLRDGVGRVGDAALDPVLNTFDAEDAIAIKLFDTINELSLDNDTYETLTEGSIDPYLTIRDAYLQVRKKDVEE